MIIQSGQTVILNEPERVEEVIVFQRNAEEFFTTGANVTNLLKDIARYNKVELCDFINSIDDVYKNDPLDWFWNMGSPWLELGLSMNILISGGILEITIFRSIIC